MLPLLHVATRTYAFHWELHPDVIALCVAMLAAYWYAVTQLRKEIYDAGRVKPGQVVCFTLGVLSIYAVSSSPVHELAEGYLASVHMLQHLVYTMVAPPLLLFGLPAWLLRAPLRSARVFRVARILTLPLLAFALFNAVQLLTHLPATVDLSLQIHSLHFAVHAALVAAALLMWWPILSPIPELPRLTYPLQMAYLFVQSLLPSVLAAFLTFSEGVFYKFYDAAPRIAGITVIEDQQFAGFVMKIAGSLILWSFIAYAFFKWYAQETADAREPVWDDVKEEMRTLGLPLDGRSNRTL
jgi:putative membrane protein